MSKKIILFLLGFVFLFGFRLTHAGVVINEVQLNPIEERFIELYNSGSSAVDLTGWYIQRKTKTQIQNGSDFSSLVSKPNFQNKTIDPGKYFLISKSAVNNADIILENFSLTESNIIQIKNLNQEVVDKMGWGDLSANDCGGSCAPDPTDGKSIQKTSNNSWIVATPSPKKQNESVNQTPPPQGGGVGSGSFTQNTTEPKTKMVEAPKIKTKITSKTLVFKGIPIEFSASASGYSNESLTYGKYFWNFGDGDSKEIKLNEATKFEHIFSYEGEYAVTLEYYQNYYSEIPDATDKITIKVLSADVSISKVGDEKDFFVEITNNTLYDADLSKWMLSSNTKSFTLPKNTILASKKKIILSPRITGFSVSDKGDLKLLNPQAETVFDYSASAPLVKILAKNTSSAKIPVAAFARNALQNDANKNSPENLGLKTPADNLLAQVIKSDANTADAKNNLMYGIGLFIFLGIGASTAYFVRSRNRKTVLDAAGNDFEIMDG